MTTPNAKQSPDECGKPSSSRRRSSSTSASRRPRHTHIGGSIFKGSKQLMILVAVEARPSQCEEIAALIVDHLNRRKK